MVSDGLSILNPRPVKLPGPKLLHRLVAPPSNVLALECLSHKAKTSFTYKDLHDAADVVARFITAARRRARRADSELIVPVLIPQGPLLYISLLAVLKAGGAFCPLNLDAPPERIKFILRDVSAEMVLVSQSLASKMPPDVGVEVIEVDQLRSDPETDAFESREPEPEDLAYVMYTSGSTGTPKGVAVSHGSVTQALLAHDRHIPAFSRFLQFAAPTFDVSVFEIFFPLLRGSTLVSVRRQEMLDDLPSVLREMNVDACELTPTVAASLLRNRHSAPNLKLLLTIGEMLSGPVVQEFGGSKSKSSMLWAMYGPTEATIHCTLQTAMPSDSTLGNIGVPLDTVSCFVIEPHDPARDGNTFRVLPVGDIGELAVGGNQLARGYLNRPEQTTSAFISSPYGPVYRTGDRARLTVDGRLECLGRLASGQVKLRGQRVEIGEVEQVVLKTPGCHGAISAVVDSNLIVFCAVDRGVSEDAILMRCRDWLPRFMVPGEVILMPELPRLPSGKVDAHKLKSDYRGRKWADLSGAGSEEPAIEDEIAQLVSDTLGLKVSRAMTLASVGVDSLSAIRLASVLHLAGYDVDAAGLLKLRTIADLCSNVRRRPMMKSVDRRPSDVSLLSSLDQVMAENPDLDLLEDHIEDILPCNPLQSAMLAETEQNPILYCNTIELQGAPGINFDDVLSAFRQVTRSNEVLRTGFARFRGGYAAIVFNGPDVDNGLRAEADFDRDFAFRARRDFLRPFRIQARQHDDGSGLQLLIQAHHAIYDGWSMDMILSDVCALLCRTSAPSRPQFRDVLRYQFRNSKMAAEDTARKFWSEHLLGWNKTPLPKLTARSSAPNEFRSIQKTLAIPAEEVREAALMAPAGTQVLFQASLALLWSGIIGASDIVLGSVTSGRTIPVDRVDEILGPCIASLPIRVNLSSAASKRDLLKNVHASNRAIMEHCALPLAEVKKLTGLQPSESLYDVLFVYQESLETRKQGDRLFTEIQHLDRLETSVLFEVRPHEAGYAIQVTYHASKFAPGLVECLVQQFEDILRSLLHDHDDRLNLTNVSAASKQSIYNEAVQTLRGTPDLAAQFEETAATIPTAPALCFSNSSSGTAARSCLTTYQELNRAANQVAHYLSTRDIAVGDVVAIVMHKSPLFYTSVLGIQKAGCAYLPLLPSTPAARVRAIFEQARVKHCVVDSACVSLLSLSGENVRLHDIEGVDIRVYAEENRHIPADPTRLAYVIYTSGTTGVPKGVAVTQKNIVSNVALLRSTYPAPTGPQPRLLQACSQAFDVSVFEIFFAWHAGMCLCAASNDDLFEDLENAIRRMEITHLSLTPTVASLVDPANVPTVEFLVTAGEPMILSVRDRWGDRLWQGYGPSETTNICSVKQMTADENIEHLGWAFPNTSTFVMSPSSLETVPIGWVGEFCFGGDQVARGYLNDARLTNEKFLVDPKFGRIYRSGDLGRMLPDGSLVIMGRLDDQIKIRGQRIAAGEINSIITGTGLASAAATVSFRPRRGASDQLVSFFVPSEGSPEFEVLQIEPEVNRRLFATLAARVPSYMVPSYLVPLSQIPVTPSGKLDRRRLQASFGDLPSDYREASSSTTQGREDEREWSQIESTIADVIAQSNSVSRADIRRWSPFAALGVDSISAINISRTLSSRLESRMSISDILQNPTVAQLGRLVEARGNCLAGSARSIPDLPTIATFDEVNAASDWDPEDIEEILPCTPLQESMLSRGSGSYCNKILLRLRIRADQMRAYWDEMTRRHGILRTFFATTKRAEHPIVQVILKRRDTVWETFDVHAPSLAGAVHEHLGRLPDPLDSGKPPLSCAFMRYKGSTFFSLICHHALYDGIAMDNLWREIESMANDRPLPPPVSFKSFMHQITSLPEDLDAFWADHFDGFRPSILFSRSAGAQIDQCTHTVSLDITLAEVKGRLRSLGLSLLSACQAAWASLLSAVCNSSDVAFGNVFNGRTSDMEGLDRLIAPCFNTIPMRIDLLKTSQNIEVARYFQDTNSRMIKYQFTPLRRIQKVANCQRRTLFDTLLLLQHPLKEMDESVWNLEEDSGDMDVPLICEIVPCPNLNSVVINVHYDINTVSEDVATTSADLFKYLFRRLVEVPLASPDDRSTLPGHFMTIFADLAPRREKPRESGGKQDEEEAWTKEEAAAREVMAELSCVSQRSVTRHTSIFKLGLDSINAVQIASILRQKGYRVSASDVVECANCASLGHRMLHASQSLHQKPQMANLNLFSSEVSAQISSAISTAVGRIEAVLPTSPVQSAMLASFTESPGRMYLNTLTYRVNDGVEMADLIQAWKVVQRQHPMLRTGFVLVNHRQSSYAMVRYEESSTSPPIEGIELERSKTFDLRQWQEESRKQLDLQRPPWKAVLVDHADHLTMSLVIHHALYDAQSLQRILEGLSHFVVNRKDPAFRSIEPALAEILSRTEDGQAAAQEFWTRNAGNAVVNNFPILTPLREEKTGLLTHEAASSMSFGFLRDAAKNCGCSIQALVQAAWARVLSSYHGESSVVFGVTMSGRTTNETQISPFPCIVTLPILATNSQSNRELMNGMMEFNSEMHKHQFAPLSQIQKWLGHPATPIFDTLLVYQKGVGRVKANRQWTLLEDKAAVEYAVSLEVEPLDTDKICLRLTFADDVVPLEQGRLLVEQFDAVLHHLASEPFGNEDELHLRRPDIFSITPATILQMPAPVVFLHEFVERRSASHPDAIALEFVSNLDESVGSRRWSYRELDLMGNRAANALQEFTVPGDIVAIHFPKSAEAYFSILGILKAGCAFVALDPSAPDARKEFIMKDSHAKCLMVDNGSKLGFDTHADILQISEESLRQQSCSRPSLEQNPLTPAHTCYCLYTSGTTGTPKGCEISHESAVQAMMAFQELFKGHWEAGSRWLQFAALHFDVSVLEQYWSWSVGITVVSAPRELILDDLAGAINELGITHIDLTPSLARLTHPDDVPSLCRGVFITGGEQLQQEILDNWGPMAVIYNAYGPTEATIGVTMYQRVPVNGRPSNIGRQFPNVGSYVFHPMTEIPVLRGGVGELCVSGKLVGKGYLNRPELTEDRFPTLAGFGERVYRTGDLVRILHDGCFEFLGRADDQVKLRGQRLEIGEINHAIRAGAPDIHDVATTLVRRETAGKDVLVSFLVTKQPPDVPQDLSVLPDVDGAGARARAACLERLPAYMVPTYFLRLPRIPLSPNNKVEAKELKALFAGLSHEELMKLAAATPSAHGSRLDKDAFEKVVRTVSEFCNVSGDKITQSTSIFDLGVDSITALQLAALLRAQGLWTASPSVLLKCPVIADLVTALSTSSQPTRPWNTVREAKQLIQACHHRNLTLVCRELGVGSADIEYIAPCSPLQQGIIFKATSEESTGAYFACFELRLNCGASIGRVRKSWSQLIDSHAMLRSVFLNTPDGHIQAAPRRTKAVWKDLTVMSEGDVATLIESRTRDWVARNKYHVLEPIELIHIHGPACQRLFVHIFHALYDGISLKLMSSHASDVYQKKQPAPALPFVEALAHGPLSRYDHCRQFWAEHLHGWEPSPVPTLAEPEDRLKAVTATRSVSIRRLEELRSQQNVTLQSVVLAAWATVLRQHVVGAPTIGVIISGRSMDLRGVDRIIGPLFNTVPFFIGIGGHTRASLIRAAHDFSTSILPFQHVPLTSIQKWCSGGRALFDNLFAFQLEQPGWGDELAPWVLEDRQGRPDYPLALEATRTLDGHLRLCLVAQSTCADAALLENLLDHFESVAEAGEAGAAVFSSPSHFETGEAWTGNDGQGADLGTTVAPFSWTGPTASVIEEVARLADISPEEITATTSWLHLGLDSIDAVKLSTRLRRRGVTLSASNIMRSQSISSMIAQADVAGPTEVSTCSAERPGLLQDMGSLLLGQVKEAGVDLDTVESVLHPTALQESMVAGMIQSDFRWYFNHDILEVAPWVDMQRLRDAWSDLVDSAPILRSGFLQVDDATLDLAYCQVIFRNRTPVITNATLSAESEISQIISSATQRATEGMGLQNTFQLSFATLGERNFVIISMAHALYDGWSLGLLHHDLEAAYRGQICPRPSADSFLLRMLESRTAESHGFWAGHLMDLRPTILTGTGTPLGEEPTAAQLFRKEAFSGVNLSTIIDFCKRRAISLQALCVASWAMVAASRAQALDVVFGLTLSGRDGEGAEELMFPTMNTVAMRCILHGSVSGFLKYVEETIADVRYHQHFPLRKAHAAAKSGSSKMFNSLFLLQRSPEQGASFSPLLWSVGGESAVEYPVCVEAEPIDGGLIWRVACQAQLFSRGETETLINQLEQVLKFILERETAEVLSFHGEDVSICGMPAVAIREAAPIQGSPEATLGLQDEADNWRETDSAIRDAVCHVLGVPPESIKPWSNLHQLGLDSISAIKVSVLLRKRRVHLKPRELVDSPSLEDMARSARLGHETEEQLSRTDSQWMPPRDIDAGSLLAEHGLGQDAVEAILPASPMQAYMLTAWQNSCGSLFFPEFRFRVEGPVDTLQARKAWLALLGKMPILRTRFIATGSKEVPWIQMIAKEDAVHSGLVSQPLVNFRVVEGASGEGLTIRLRIHHALYDGFSLPALMRRLGDLLIGDWGSKSNGILHWARHCIGLPMARVERREFWTKYLRGGAPISVPPTLSEETKGTTTSYLDVSAINDVAPLRAVALRHAISLQSLVLAALATSIGGQDACSGEKAVVLGIYLASRAEGQDSPLAVYPTLNLVPLKVQLGRGCSAITLARGIQEDIHSMGIAGRADVGLWEILAWTGMKIDCFINFLAEPPVEAASADPEPVTLTPIREEVGEGDAADGELSASTSRAAWEEPWLQKNSIRDAIQLSVDIEAAVHGQGLALGVFGPHGRVSNEWAAKLVADTAAFLGDVAG